MLEEAAGVSVPVVEVSISRNSWSRETLFEIATVGSARTRTRSESAEEPAAKVAARLT